MIPVGLYVYVAVAIVSAALAGWGAWTVHGWRLGEQIATIKAAQLEAVNTATREARATESRRYQEVHDAQVKSAQRAQVARADSAAAHSELSRLRDAIAARPVCVPGDTASAGDEPSSQRDNVLLECLSSYEALGRDADLWKNDAIRLYESWPK